MEEVKRHTVSMENRKKVTICEVEDVESFDEEKVCVHTSMGMLTVIGSDFRIHKLNVDDGQLVIEGMVDELKYSQTHHRENQGSLFSRLFQ
ncbi:MAG: sporulation protein YabP [Clostridia bacterium]|nr:sporulation protein YabP [Clostridia bacterium]